MSYAGEEGDELSIFVTCRSMGRRGPPGDPHHFPEVFLGQKFGDTHVIH